MFSFEVSFYVYQRNFTSTTLFRVYNYDIIMISYMILVRYCYDNYDIITMFIFCPERHALSL